MGWNVSRHRAVEEETPNISMLEKLPAGPVSEITSYLNQIDISTARKSSRGLAGLFKNDLEQCKAHTFVLQGNETAALALLGKSPELLLIRKKAVDYSGREYYGTPFQAALLSYDAILCEKMEPLFDKLPDGKAKLAEQVRELFPNGTPEQTAFDLESITQAISGSPDADINAIFQKKKKETPIYKQITSFRQQFTAASLEEKFFNPEHLFNAYTIFVKHYDGWTAQQRGAFFSLVIGYMQRFLPAFYAQAYCQGLRNVNLKDNNFKRSLTLSDGSVMLPLADDSGPGFDCGIYSTRARGDVVSCVLAAVPWSGPWGRAHHPLRDLKDFVEQIRQTYLAYGIDFQTPERPLASKAL